MLHFFRKFQWYFFLMITIVIVISFSFFGTYDTLPQVASSQQEAFTTVRGRSVSATDLNAMVAFIGTDNEDKLLFGGAWGPNFLNDGVVKRDFLRTGMGEELGKQYSADLKNDLQQRMQKEKRFTPYAHPQAKFVSVESAWEYLSPDIKDHYETLRRMDDAGDPEAFAARVRLFIAEKRLPSTTLRQVLRYQEQQHEWLQPDPNLDRTDLSLFGYHTVEDWFGPQFLRLLGQFIINSAQIAEEKGYVVTQEEAIADLRRNAEISFQQNRKNPRLGVRDSREYFQEQLRRMGMNANGAAKVWRQVLLFRRLFQDAGNSVFVDPLSFEQFQSYAQEMVEGDLYQLPRELWLRNYRSLQKLETYLDAVAKRPENIRGLLIPPYTFLSVGQVKTKHPELVQKQYTLEMASFDKKGLQAKVGLREMWDWEVEDANWEGLKSRFPELGVKKGDTREDRFAALEVLGEVTRSRVDKHAREKIIESHPEWIVEGLKASNAETRTIGLRGKGGHQDLVGLKDGRELIRLLDKAPIGEETEKLNAYSPDKQHYYRIIVVERAPKEEILTFTEADASGVLDEMLHNNLKEHQAKNPGKYGDKELDEVRDQVADDYFAKTLDSIKKEYTIGIAPERAPKQFTGDFLASIRFYPYLRSAKTKIERDPKVAQSLVRGDDDKKDLNSQWKLTKKEHRITRSQEAPHLDKEKLLALQTNSWAPIQVQANGDLHLFYVRNHGKNLATVDVVSDANRAHRVLSAEAQRILMKDILREIQEANAIVLDQAPTYEEIEPES